MSMPGAIQSMRGYEALRGGALRAINRGRQPRWYRRKLIADYLATHDPAKLNIGCGTHPLSGWLNTEYDSVLARGSLYLDVTRPFPIPDASFDFVFSEHMIEHVPLAAAMHMLRECFRVLKPGGRIRIATPRMEFLVELMTAPGGDHQRYADYHYEGLTEEPWLQTPARIASDYYRLWGHQFVYDEPTLSLLLERVGFANVRRETVNESSDPQLRGIENDSRMPSGLLALTTLVLEAEKPSG